MSSDFKFLFLENDGSDHKSHSCFCVGPQDGDPVCPCQMPSYRQRQAERAAWEREIARQLIKETKHGTEI